MEQLTGPDGQTLYCNRRDGKRGAKGPFYVVYTDETADTRWGFYCGNCETLDNAVDAMGRVQCNRCSNRTKAEEWDAAHE
jgi:hypothetical protein